MKKVITLLIVMTVVLLYGIFSATAQTMTTREAKVVVAVNTENNTIQALILFADLDTKEDQLREQYSNCKFFIGLMEGSYKVVQAMVRPQRGATVSIFYNQPLFGDTDMAFMDYYSPGDLIKIENLEARVISNNKGELILKTQ
ncbi:hypothetical protein [Eudoraea sp.]|uniref:hypothetical protein n=1 Tax=Eudoraea sp. TaxID=1979955 RepID=UPI003C724359